MKQYVIPGSLFLASMLTAVGCGAEVEDFRKAKTIEIQYRVNGQKKDLTVSEKKVVKEILDTISIHSTEKRAPGWICFNHFNFKLPDDKEIGMFLCRAQVLDRPDSGLIYLNDTKYYDKINEIVSRKEGREIDVLKDNK